MKYDYSNLVQRLQADIITVTFEKVDGTERKMRCTLLPSYLPEAYQGKTFNMLTETVPTTISVWDVDNSGCRSFRVDLVRNVE